MAVTAAPPALSFAEQVCLAIVAEGVSHGWAVGSLLAPDGDLGRVWSLSRPLTYRALDGLAEQRLITRRDAKTGRGRDRRVLTATARGRKISRAWLGAPVDHLRDVRTELLVKLALRQRAGLEPGPLLSAQAERFEPLIAALSIDPPSTGDAADLVTLWRREHARAVRRFLIQALAPATSPNRKGRPEMRLSARNQLRATVDSVTHGDVMATVAVRLPDGQRLTAAITRDATEELDLSVGDAVIVIVKSTEVMIAKDE